MGQKVLVGNGRAVIDQELFKTQASTARAATVSHFTVSHFTVSHFTVSHFTVSHFTVLPFAASHSSNVSHSNVPAGWGKTPSALIVLLLCVLALACLVVPLDAFAAGGAHGAHAVTPPPFSEFISHLLKFWVNFLLYCFLLFLVVRRPLVQAYAARRLAIEDKVLAGARAMEAARRDLATAEARMQSLPSELERVRKEINAETQAEVASAHAEGKTRSRRITDQAADSIAAERRSVEQQVEQELIAAALLLAREKLEKGSTQESDRLVRDAALKLTPRLVQ